MTSHVSNHGVGPSRGPFSFFYPLLAEQGPFFYSIGSSIGDFHGQAHQKTPRHASLGQNWEIRRSVALAAYCSIVRPVFLVKPSPSTILPRHARSNHLVIAPRQIRHVDCWPYQSADLIITIVQLPHHGSIIRRRDLGGPWAPPIPTTDKDSFRRWLTSQAINHQRKPRLSSQQQNSPVIIINPQLLPPWIENKNEPQVPHWYVVTSLKNAIIGE